MNIRLLSIIIVVFSDCYIHAEDRPTGPIGNESVTITVPEAWKYVKESNLLLKIKTKEVEMANAELKQEKLFDNPQVDISHNINNPITNRYFDIGREGETDIQLSQRIYIGGQRSERIKKANEEVYMSEYERNDAMRLLKRKLTEDMVQLDGLRKKEDIVDREIASMEKILKAYGEQQSKGNISQMEVMRISRERMQLIQEKCSICAEIATLQTSIGLMTGLNDGRSIIPMINYEGNISTLNGFNLSIMNSNLYNRADIQAIRHSIKSAEHNVKLQKANALPEINLTGEWDKNGNIGYNFFAVGVSLTLPLFNRNQGNIKLAQASLEAKRMQHEWNKKQALSEISSAWARLQTNIRVAQEANKHLKHENEKMMDEVEKQYMKHNISLLELLDYYKSYKDTRYLIIESHRDVLLSMTELDIEIK